MEIACDYCNKQYMYKGGVSHYNRTKGHYCSRTCQNMKHGLAKRGKQDKRYKIWCDVKKRAKLKDTAFTLTIEDVPEIPEYCPILGIKIIASKVNGPIDSSPSLDRIDATKGYIPGNVQIISNRANRIKSDATAEELEKVYLFVKGSL